MTLPVEVRRQDENTWNPSTFPRTNPFCSQLAAIPESQTASETTKGASAGAARQPGGRLCHCNTYIFWQLRSHKPQKMGVEWITTEEKLETAEKSENENLVQSRLAGASSSRRRAQGDASVPQPSCL